MLAPLFFLYCVSLQLYRSYDCRYDVMNDFMSGGMHRVWKDSFVETLHPVGPLKCLDVAGGTGDIAFRIAERLSKTHRSNEASQITICDINSSMLEVGKARAAKAGHHVDPSLFRWVEGNAEHLDFEDNSFDGYTIVFGIRNVTHVDRAIQEAYRVLKPGGRFMCMEFSQVPNPLIRQFYDAVRRWRGGCNRSSLVALLTVAVTVLV